MDFSQGIKNKIKTFRKSKGGERIKADTGNNPELEYQLRVVKNKPASLGIPPEEYEM